MTRLAEKSFIVTGAARGMGAAIAGQLVREGAFVVVTDIRDAEGEALVQKLGPRARYLCHDVSDEAGWARAISLAQDLSTLGGLVNNAGIYQPASLMETDSAQFMRHVQINQLGCFLGLRAVVPALMAAGGGSIVNMSSVAGVKAAPGAFSYSATKWALRGMTKSAAKDLAPSQIRVNSVHPGLIDTPMLDVQSPEENARRAKLVPMGRMGLAEEVAELVVFLLSDNSRYITGTEHVIDGASSL